MNLLKKIYKIIFIAFVYILFILLLNADIIEKSKINKFTLQNNFSNKTALFENINEYITVCRKGMLLREKIYYYNNTPKITSIIPVFNASKTIKAAIRSIQNQNMDDIEIILVDDVSTDNSTSIINELMIEDRRIKLIKNKRNRGILYSRSIGALNAKGKYIMALDNDDLFINGIFNKCYEEAEKNNLDIVEFSGLQICDNCLIDENKIMIPYYLRFKKNGLIIKQPDLSTFLYVKTNNTHYNYDFRDVFVWGKIIKTVTYLNSLKFLGNEVLNYNVYLTEDKIFTVGLFKIANSFKFIDVYGILYIRNPNSICSRWIKSKRKRIMKDFLIFSVFFFKISKDKEEVHIVLEDLKIRFHE